VICPVAVFVSVLCGLLEIVMDLVVGQSGLSRDAVIGVDLWLDVAHHLQQVANHSLLVLLKTALDVFHLINGLLIHLDSRVSMGP